MFLHKRISGALFAVLREKPEDRRCDVFLADMNVRTDHVFYFEGVWG